MLARRDRGTTLNLCCGELGLSITISLINRGLLISLIQCTSYLPCSPHCVKTGKELLLLIVRASAPVPNRQYREEGENFSLCTLEKWERPPVGWVKANVDESFVPQTGDAGIGVVVRNNEGEVLLSVWKALQHCSDAAEAEALACVEGFRHAAQPFQVPVIF